MSKSGGDDVLEGFVSAAQAEEQLRCPPVLFRWVAHLLAIKTRNIGTVRLFQVSDLQKIDAYLTKHDPGQRFRSRPNKRGRKPVEAESEPVSG